ncbi:penicillin-binding protein 1A [Nitrincola sp. MINF-07-Sa-05]|uniref:penicillin-binding protein 1A n=1 Tax=Nitrincola salilacus TaxID=3400273 RepID=UPI0039182ED4
MAGGAFAFAWYYFSPDLPDVQELREIKFQTPLRVLSADGLLMAEFGEQRRTPISFEQTPQNFIYALQAAEDSRFFEHHGIDIKGLSRAALQLVQSGQIQSGGSTITMQVAKNFFLSRERTFERKFVEILLALRIEQELTKEEILELYINKIYLGQRAYGIQAAANVYYGKDISELSLAQLAMIAGLPKAPSASNPITNPQRSTERRNWILGRMLALEYIDQESYREAVNEPEVARYHISEIELSAPYVAEMVRQELFNQYGEEAYTDGYTVMTTLDSNMQQAADSALRKGLREYNERHGYYGAESTLEISTLTTSERLAELRRIPVYANLLPALVTEVQDQSATILLRDGTEASVAWSGMSWARAFRTVNSMGPVPERASDVVKAGDIIRVSVVDDDNYHLEQIPRVQGALVALDPHNGAIKALSGGFSFAHNNFNRAVQAYRQPGSTLKPFIYTSALEEGFSPGTIVHDSPIVFHDVSLDGEWRPENYTRDFDGPIRLREALYRSRNLVTIRVLRDLGVQRTRDELLKFGFEASRTPAALSLALGTSDTTPLQMATGFAAFANSGYRIDPYFIDEIHDQEGNVIFEANPFTLCRDNCASEAAILEDLNNASELAERRIMSETTAFLMNDMLLDVIRRGTGRRAQTLSRSDLAGKTGTTNENKDSWFTGYNRDLVATVWVGYDQPESLGRNEFGSTAALPVWIDFISEALKDSPEAGFEPPSGIVRILIDPSTGELAYPGQSNAMMEYYREDTAPSATASTPEQRNSGSVIESIFGY